MSYKYKDRIVKTEIIERFKKNIKKPTERIGYIEDISKYPDFSNEGDEIIVEKQDRVKVHIPFEGSYQVIKKRKVERDKIIYTTEVFYFNDD